MARVNTGVASSQLAYLWKLRELDPVNSLKRYKLLAEAIYLLIIQVMINKNFLIVLPISYKYWCSESGNKIKSRMTHQFKHFNFQNMRRLYFISQLLLGY